MNNILKKTPEEFHIFVIIFSVTGIRTDLPAYLFLTETLTITLLGTYRFVVF